MQGISRAKHKALMDIMLELDEILREMQCRGYDPSHIRELERLMAHYESLLEELKTCIDAYETLYSNLRFNVIRPFCTELRKNGEDVPTIHGILLSQVMK